MKRVRVPNNVAVNTDKRSGTKNFAVPFTFDDGTQGAIIVCRLSETEWKPDFTGIILETNQQEQNEQDTTSGR